MKKQIITLCFLVMALFVWSQEPIKQKLEMRLDSVGNANIKVTMELNASQWQIWLQSTGNNPAMLKRQMERSLPAYFLDDFELKKDDMKRTFAFTFNAYGVCKVDKKGRWILTTDQKDPDITELSDRKYMMMYTEMASNLQQTQIITFPDEASNISIEKDAFGKTQFVFDMNTPGSGFSYLLWGGIALCLIGGGWIVRGLMA